MSQSGKNPTQTVIVIIPARYASSRLEGKLLLPIGGKPLILHTLEQARKARNVNRIIVATDDERILQVVQESGNEAVLTSPNHQSGSDRIAEVAANLPTNSIIVNVQGDEPMIPPSTIEKAVEVLLNDENVVMSTTCEKIEDFRDVINPDLVKVVTDEDGFALYFSRSPIPFPRDSVKKYGSLEKALENEPSLIANFRKHTGLYVYRREFLLEFTKMAQSKLEKIEMLEQLRALENGVKIKVVEVEESSIGVDTQEDFERVKGILEGEIEQFQSEDFTFRRVRVDDLPKVAKTFILSTKHSFQEILPQAYLNGLSVEKEAREFWRAFLKGGSQIFVVENANSEIVGYVEFEKMPEESPFDAKINSFYIIPEYQRKGIGSKLFAFVLNEITSQNGKSIVLQALDASPYNGFYDKQSGKIVGFSSVDIGGEKFKTLVYFWEVLSKI